MVSPGAVVGWGEAGVGLGVWDVGGDVEGAEEDVVCTARRSISAGFALPLSQGRKVFSSQRESHREGWSEAVEEANFERRRSWFADAIFVGVELS